MNAFKFIILILSFTCFGQIALGQYMETFDTALKGILAGNCSGSDGTSCTLNDFSGVDWTISGNLVGVDAADFFRTTGGSMGAVDVDEEVCWVSPLLDISMAGNDVDFSVDLTWTSFDSPSDYIDVEYDINQARTF